MNYSYALYGLTAAFPFPCPALSASTGAADIICAFGTVPWRLDAPQAMGPGWQAMPRRFLYCAGSTGRLIVEEGRRITLQPGIDADRDHLMFLLHHIALPAALRQRGWLVLHAASTGDAAGAVVIAGVSGAGKSTTLAGLIARGQAMLADDIAAVRLSADGRPEIVPAIPELHLSEAAARRLGCDIGGVSGQPWHRMKLPIPASAAMAVRPLPLRALFVLAPSGSGNIRVTRLCGANRFIALHEAVAGPWFPENQATAFPVVSAILAGVPVIRIERPAGRWSLSEIMDIVRDG